MRGEGGPPCLKTYRCQNLVVTGGMTACIQQLAGCCIDEVAGLHHHMVHVCLVQPVVYQGLIQVVMCGLACCACLFPWQVGRMHYSHMFR